MDKNLIVGMREKVEIEIEALKDIIEEMESSEYYNEEIDCARIDKVYLKIGLNRRLVHEYKAWEGSKIDEVYSSKKNEILRNIRISNLKSAIFMCDNDMFSEEDILFVADSTELIKDILDE